MVEKYSAVKVWNESTTESFKDELNDFFNEEKCEYAAEIAKMLIKRGSESDLSGAESILLYVVDNFLDVDFSDCKAAIYLALGELYEKKEDFGAAYDSYEKYSLFNTLYDGASILLMRAMLLRDDFSYSDELEKLLLRSYGEIDLGLRSDRLYETAARLITAEHYGDAEKCRKLKKQLKAIVKADEIFIPDLFFRKDDIRDVLEVPEKTLDFVNSLIVEPDKIVEPAKAE